MTVIDMRVKVWRLLDGRWVWCCPWHNEAESEETWRWAMERVARHLEYCHVPARRTS